MNHCSSAVVAWKEVESAGRARLSTVASIPTARMAGTSAMSAHQRREEPEVMTETTFQ